MAQAGQYSPAVNLGAGGFPQAGLVSYFDNGGAVTDALPPRFPKDISEELDKLPLKESRAAFNQLPEEEQLRVEAYRRETEFNDLADLEMMVDLQGQLPEDFKFSGKYGLPSYLARTGGVPFDKKRMADIRTFGHDPDNPGDISVVKKGKYNILGRYFRPASSYEAEQGIGSLGEEELVERINKRKKAFAERLNKRKKIFASTTVEGPGSLRPDSVYFQQGLPFNDPRLTVHHPETSGSPGAVVMHELMHRQSRLPEIRESYDDYASTLPDEEVTVSSGEITFPQALAKKYRDAGEGHGLISLLEKAMDSETGWPNPEAIKKLLEENPKLSVEEAMQLVKDTGDMTFGDPLRDDPIRYFDDNSGQVERLDRFAKFNEDFAEFLREKGKGDPRYLIPRDAPLEPEPRTVMDIIRNQYNKILGRKPED